MHNNYNKAIIFCLKTLSCTIQEDAEYMDEFMEFCRLYRSLDEVFARGLVSEDQYEAIKVVFIEMDKLTDHAKTLTLHTDQYYLTAPEWEPTKEAARKALTLF